MPSPIADLTARQRREWLSDLNYLNLGELKSWCRTRSIPYAIRIETPHGERRRTGPYDRKGVILERVRHYLNTGEVGEPTCFPARVVRHGRPPARLRPSDRMFYGQYHKAGGAMVGLLQRLTGGRFRNGAVARILAREFWSTGVAPTHREFAAAWLEASAGHIRPNPEWAFLSDRADGRQTADWKALRARKAKRVLELLDRLAPVERAGAAFR